jgi:hypothetical protein
MIDFNNSLETNNDYSLNNNNNNTNVNDSKQRTVFFIDTSNPTNSTQIITTSSSHPFIKPPFPPVVDTNKLIVKQNGKLPARSPNAFIIYRKVFLDKAQADGYTLPMTVISAMVSKSWESESKYVKDEYKKLAKEAYNRLNEMNPKSTKPNKRERWNMVSFDQKKSKSRLNKNVKQLGNRKSIKSNNKSNPSTITITVESNHKDIVNNSHEDDNNNNPSPLLSFSPFSTTSTNSSPDISPDFDLLLNDSINDYDINNNPIIQNLLNESSFTPNFDNFQGFNQFLNFPDQDILLPETTIYSNTTSNDSSPDIDNLFYNFDNFQQFINNLNDCEQQQQLQQQQQQQPLQYDFLNSSSFNDNGLGISFNFDNNNNDNNFDNSY